MSSRHTLLAFLVFSTTQWGADGVAAPLSPSRAGVAVAEAARRNLPASVVEIEVLGVSVRAPLDVPEAAVLRVRAAPDEPWLGQVAVDIDVFDGGTLLGTVPAVAQVLGWAEVPVLQTPIARGAAVEAPQVGLVRREVDGLQAGWILDARRLVGRVARRDLPLGQPVRDQDLEAPIDARRMQPVTIVVWRGGMRLSSPGVLRADARIGDLVAVWNEGTKVEQRGVLKSNDVVELPVLGPLAAGGPR